MLIDPFTVLAQIVNFLILVALLKHFLYGPITRAMAQREQTIADRLEQAEQQETLAHQETQKLQQMQQDFAAHRDQRLAQLRSQLEDQQLTLLATAKDEVATAKAGWLRALEQEKATALRTFRQQAAEQLSQTMRQALGDLADAELEQQILNRFVHRLGQLPPAEQQVLQSALIHADGAPVTVRSSFPLPAARQAALITALQALAPEHKLTPQFELAPALGCGIELVMPGYKLAWNLATYLDRLEQNLALNLNQHLDPEPTTLSV
jgi:F-type H+-transporting ATPase subunit b